MNRTYWTFTLCNPTNDETVFDLETTLEGCRYSVFQLEQGENGIIHYQGFIRLCRAQKQSYVKKLLPRAHWEPVRSNLACRRYCMKAETRLEGPWEQGIFKSAQGKRTDLIDLKRRALKTSDPIISILSDTANNQQFRFIQNIRAIKPISKEYNQREVYWYHGKTGTGKTRKAYAESSEDYWLANLDGQWFDGYTGQKDVIIDDIRAKQWPYVLLLRLLDGYKLRLPIKCGHTVWEPERVWITSPLPPQTLFAGQLQFNGSIDQLLRRITQIMVFTLDTEEEVTEVNQWMYE